MIERFELKTMNKGTFFDECLFEIYRKKLIYEIQRLINKKKQT